MADSPTNRTHILKSRMLSRRDLMILCGTGTYGKAGEAVRVPRTVV